MSGILICIQDLKDYKRRKLVNKAIQADDEDDELADDYIYTPWGRRKSIIM